MHDLSIRIVLGIMDLLQKQPPSQCPLPHNLAQIQCIIQCTTRSLDRFTSVTLIVSDQDNGTITTTESWSPVNFQYSGEKALEPFPLVFFIHSQFYSIYLCYLDRIRFSIFSLNNKKALFIFMILLFSLYPKLAHHLE